MDNEKTKKKPSKLKIIYAFALLMALGSALVAKITTEKSLGNITVPIENEYVSNTTIKVTEEHTVKEVRENLTDVPDTRIETKVFVKDTEEQTTKKTEKVNYATPYSDYYSLPLSDDIVKDYSDNVPVYSNTMKDWRVHNAIDFKGEDGAQVKAISNGTVLSVKADVFWGSIITIDHGNDVVAKYCGLNKDTIVVKKGTTVETGTVLGHLGTIPCEKEDGAHLHFEILYKNSNVEPLKLMGK